MQRKADTDARASILRGDIFQRFQISAFEDYVISKIDQHFITAQMFDPSATATTCPVLIGLNTMKLDFRLGWNACERMLQSPAYSGCLYGSEVDGSTVMRLQAVIIHNALDCTLAPSDQRANAAFGLTVTPSKAMYGGDSAGQLPGNVAYATGSNVQAASGLNHPMRDSGNSFPDAADLIGSAFGRQKISNCRCCQKPGHDIFECPTNFFRRTGQCMPGFDRAGNRLNGYWYDHAQVLGPSKTVAQEWLAHVWQQNELHNSDRHNGGLANPPCLGKTLWESWARGSFPTK